MNEERMMSLSVYLAPPGTGRDIRKKGLQVDAVVDTGADISVVSPSIIRQVFGDKQAPYGLVSVTDFTGVQSMIKTVPMTITLETKRGQLISAQVECLQGASDEVTIGADVLSMLGLSVTLDYKKNQVLVERYSWESFEDEVASIFRAIGATVKHNVSLAGFQIDIVVSESTASKQELKLAVECKFYKERVGNRIVNDFSRVVETLKQANLIDRGILVSSSGFTQDASLVARNTGIELLTIDDLRQAALEHHAPIQEPIQEEKDQSVPLMEQPAIREPTTAPRIFVVMPFTAELDDAYHLGIRQVAVNLGFTCERADEMQYVGGVIEKIYDSIRDADVVVAEVTMPNPNVYYEVGFAHAIQVPVILLTRDVQATRFDLRGYRHIVYSSIVDLQNKLEGMLDRVMQDNESQRTTG